MKAFSKRFLLVLIIMTIVLSPLPCEASSSSTSAKFLQSLGLLSNVSDKELDTTLNRIVGLTMILKTLGYKDRDAAIASKSSQFKDLTGVYAWGDGWANLGVNAKITTGTTQTTFSPGLVLTKKEFLCFQLRALGYGVEESWIKCDELSTQLGLIPNKSAIVDVRFTKAEAADIVYAALSAPVKGGDGKTFIEYLVEDGVIDAEVASKLTIPALNRLKVDKIKVLLNNQLELTLKKPVNVVNKEEIIITDSYGTVVKVNTTSLSADGLKVNVTTEPQKAYILHKVKINDFTDEYYALAIDAIPPRLHFVTVLNNTTLKLIFSEDLHESALSTAYYKIEGVSVLSAKFEKNSKDENILNSIILTTSPMTGSTQYKVVVSGIKDLAGNTINPNFSQLSFFAPITDTIRPRVISVYSISENEVRVIFSESVDEATAELTSNYKIDGLTVLEAVRRENYSIVDLKTTPQTVGYIYKLTVSNVKDLNGNTVDNTYNNFSFIGRGRDNSQPYVVSAVATSNTTVVVTFSEPVTDETAGMPYAYYLGESLSYPIKVEKDKSNTSGTVWVLTTFPQEAITYTLDVTGVMDFDGNMLNEDRDTVTFTGIAE